ncbi:prepilin peptidase, partial [Campylobacter jejuni]|uniref:prepilin peptidase n=1 Tax=Campylobacter jejuni TaxID=197 RepID=UPI002F266CCA
MLLIKINKKILLKYCTSLASRIIEKKPFFISRSFCFSCDTKLKYYEIIPVFSYVFL